ncbi:hypothetical protein LOZ58_002521 [Ophidiomyces ophidiicola]|nr:hypothetical protein LOZ58_002521 [Ophidiomyces ophidiicola]
MSAPKPHPRRRPCRRSAVPALLPSDQSQSLEECISQPRRIKLKKGATFHSSSTPAKDSDPTLCIPALPRRAPSCLRTFEKVKADGEKRVAALLGSVDRNFAGSNRDVSHKHSSFSDNSFPVPRGILDAHIANTDSTGDPAHSFRFPFPNRRLPPLDQKDSRTCDSGIGSSVSALSRRKPAFGGDSTQHRKAPSQNAITRSISFKSKVTGSSKPTLDPKAFRHIERCVLIPVLNEKILKPFHPLARSVPQRVKRNDITCLRDLEKTLLFSALNQEVTSAIFVKFCEFTVQCIHTTVPFLNERDLQRPSDRPYTNGYFLDLVEQIRQYAVHVEQSRRARAAGERDKNKNQTDYSSSEELVLEGGLSKTGRPAELVRKKKGAAAISLKTREQYVEPKTSMPAMKRSLSVESVDDSVVRSMARRKKNEPPLNINKKCNHCDKIFRRPCDLTKHEKTHTRPWKCSESSCKYYKVGWPTEKERDRHVNDKHSKTPALYCCQFAPCTYQSKRESNCKQHMEKAHGWVYVRSKNTGKPGLQPVNLPPSRSSSVNAPSSAAPEASTPQSVEPTPPYISSSQSDFRPETVGSQPTHDINAIFAEDFPLFPETTAGAFGDSADSFARQFDFDAFHASLRASDPEQFVAGLDLGLPAIPSPDAQDGLGMDIHRRLAFDHLGDRMDVDLDWEGFDACDPTMSPQSAEAATIESYSNASSVGIPSPEESKIPSLSPCGQGNVMLYSPDSELPDEGFCDLYNVHKKPPRDFTLYANGALGQPTDSQSSEASSSLFHSLSAVGSQHNGSDWPVNTGEGGWEFDEYMKGA